MARIPNKAYLPPVEGEVPPERAVIRSFLSTAKRDGLGFIESDVPALGAKQVRFLGWLMELNDDEKAAQMARVEAEEVEIWAQDSGFLAMYDLAQNNKREAYRLLTGQMLGKAIRKLDELLDSDSPRAVHSGITLLLRSQGLLVDKVQHDSSDAVAQLLTMLRERTPVEPRP